MSSHTPRRVNVPNSQLKVGDVLETEVRRYVVTGVYKDKEGKPVADMLGDDGVRTSFTDISTRSVGGYHSRIGTNCECSVEGLKRFLENLEAE
jgi:hypothetical protein